MNLNYTPEAENDLDTIYQFIAEDDPRAAHNVISRILQSMAVLERFPLIGRPGRIENTREWVISGLPYIGIYTIADDTEIDVLAVTHTSMDFPPSTLRR